MRKLWMILLLLCLIVSWSGAANAQEQGKLAVVVGASNSNLTESGTVGVLWQFANRFAVRSELSGMHTDRRSSSPYSTSDNISRVVSFGVSGPITIHKQDSLRVYVSPRYARSYNFSKYKYQSTTQSVLTWTQYSVSGSFGGQYNFSRRFGVFGESGAEYMVSQPDSPYYQNTIYSWKMASTVGLLLYF